MNLIVSPLKYALELFKRKKSTFMLCLLGALMIYVGFMVDPPWHVFSSAGTDDFKNSLAAFVLFIGGIAGIAIALRYREGAYAGGIMTLALAFYFIFLIGILFPESDDPESGDMNYMIRMVFYILMAFCIMFSVKILLGSTQNTMRIVYIEMGALAIFLIMFFMRIHQGAPVSEAWERLSDYHHAALLMLVSIVCLNMSDVKYERPYTKLRLNVEALETTAVTISDTYILRSALDWILDDTYQSWEDSKEHGVEKEIRVLLYTRFRKEMFILRKWADDDTPVITFLPKDLKVHLFNNINFPVRHIYCPGGRETCGRVRLYGDNGMFVDLLVRDEHTRMYRSVLDLGAVLGIKGVYLGKPTVDPGVLLTAHKEEEEEKQDKHGSKLYRFFVGKPEEDEEPDWEDEKP